MNETESRKAFEAWCNETGRYFTTKSPEAWAVWKHLYAEVKGLELKFFLAEGKIALLEHRLNLAEAKLARLGYERECNIPACNCGDGWTHKRTEI